MPTGCFSPKDEVQKKNKYVVNKPLKRFFDKAKFLMRRFTLQKIKAKI